MLQVQGRTDVYLYLEIIKKVLAIVPIFLGIFVGIYWMLIGSVINGIINFFLNSYFTGRRLGYTSLMQLKDVVPDFGIALVVAIAVYFFKYLPLSYWIVLPMQIMVGVVVFVTINEMMKMQEYMELRGIILGMIGKKLK